MSLKGEEKSLLEEVAAIHVAYQMIKSEAYWFVQLSQHFPDVVHDVPSGEVKVLYSGGEVVSLYIVSIFNHQPGSNPALDSRVIV